MADPRKIIDMTINAETGVRSSVNGTTIFAVTDSQILWRATQYLFRCNLLLADGVTYYQPPADAIWLFGVDNVYTQGHAELVASDNAQFIAADWSAADFANGKVCWRADFTSEALKTAVGDEASLSPCYAALWMYSATSSWVLMSQWDIVVNNIAVDPTTASAQPGIVYATTDMLTVYQKQWADGASIQFKGGQHPYIYNVDDGLWYPVIVRTVNGAPQIGLGAGEAL